MIFVGAFAVLSGWTWPQPPSFGVRQLLLLPGAERANAGWQPASAVFGPGWTTICIESHNGGCEAEFFSLHKVDKLYSSYHGIDRSTYVFNIIVLKGSRPTQYVLVSAVRFPVKDNSGTYPYQIDKTRIRITPAGFPNGLDAVEPLILELAVD